MARIIDVSISTFRTMIMAKKKGILIQFLAFCEVFVWFFAARKALTTNIDSILIPVFYSLGYATGTYIGGFLSKKFMHNINSIEITTKRGNTKLVNKLRSNGYGITIIEIKNNYMDKNKDLLIVDANSKYTNDVINIVKDIDNEAFIVVKDTKYVYKGYIK